MIEDPDTAEDVLEPGDFIVLLVVVVLLIPFEVPEEPFADSSRSSPPFFISSFAPEGSDSNETETVSIHLRTSSMRGRFFG